MFNSTDWRILHFLSHHLFPNTFNDFEAQSFYPLMDWNSDEDKAFLHKYFSPFYYQLLFLSAAPLSYLNKVLKLSLTN